MGLWWLYGCGFVLAVICGGCGLWVCVSCELLWLRGYGFGCGSAPVWVVVGKIILRFLLGRYGGGEKNSFGGLEAGVFSAM
uniref:Transmembrane protein n=1 Tax=Fagus sylvatica TaxID=28930 RepID=A0A2N9FWS2_FAGSY